MTWNHVSLVGVAGVTLTLVYIARVTRPGSNYGYSRATWLVLDALFWPVVFPYFLWVQLRNQPPH